jgi:RNA polymerase sigma-70 factor, ECF subfamily
MEMALSHAGTLDERDLLTAARSGDEQAFGGIVEAHRAGLHAHCYRMLGSLHDAEDALQETLLRAWRGLARFERRSSLRSWLYTIATNVCLDAIARRPKRVLPPDHGPSTTGNPQDAGEPLIESVWIEPYPDETLGLGYAAPEARYEERESVELAFIAALQHLPSRQRAVLILREVLGFSASEVAESLGSSVASVNSALQRARRSVDERLPEQSQQATLRSLGDERVRKLVEAYVSAWRRADIDALRALLAEDVVFSMPPWAAWWRGRDTLLSLAGTVVGECPESRSVQIAANGQAAIAYYSRDSEGRFKAGAIDVITFEGERIKEITAFVAPELFSLFDLPAEVPG